MLARTAVSTSRVLCRAGAKTVPAVCQLVPTGPATPAASTSRLGISYSELHTSSSQGNEEHKAGQSSSQSTSGTPPSFNMRLTPPAAQDIQSIQKWLRSAFPSFSFPDDIALQLVTHESWDKGLEAGHNRRLGFLGRRALKFFMTLFLSQQGPNSTQAMAETSKINDLLHTSKLGDFVGRSLNLHEVMRWTPAVSDGQKGPKETGLYKIRGVAVEALLGAIYHHHGAQAARSFFTARILPSLGTFSEKEVEVFQDAIANEKSAGEAHLQRMADDIDATNIRSDDAEQTRPLSEAASGMNSHETVSSKPTLRHAQRRSGMNGRSSAHSAVEEELWPPMHQRALAN